MNKFLNWLKFSYIFIIVFVFGLFGTYNSYTLYRLAMYGETMEMQIIGIPDPCGDTPDLKLQYQEHTVYIEFPKKDCLNAKYKIGDTVMVNWDRNETVVWPGQVQYWYMVLSWGLLIIPIYGYFADLERIKREKQQHKGF